MNMCQKQAYPRIALLFSLSIIPLLSFLLPGIIYNEMWCTIFTIVIFCTEIMASILYVIYCYRSKWKLTINSSFWTVEFPIRMSFKPRFIPISSHTFNIEDIVKIEYYRIISLRAWLELLVHGIWEIVPRCVYLNVKIDGNIKRIFIGYMNYSQVKKVCNKCNVPLDIR